MHALTHARTQMHGRLLKKVHKRRVTTRLAVTLSAPPGADSDDAASSGSAAVPRIAFNVQVSQLQSTAKDNGMPHIVVDRRILPRNASNFR